ncbi:MAG: Uncharacterized protein AWT59_2781 [Candidatus Gallionella acididurans]|uniref:Uncharacterized protein n=1 Tax=Candidatus Gallionella acididurans TaxID=1796491 RepID=A0A139BQ40_9PROT|nr:MAG: Uncharacterized protein AWT59_2781 [Candidatus Gallionella acididurans]
MSDSISNAYNHSGTLQTNKGATAAVVDMLTSACGAGDETNKQYLLEWALAHGNFKKLRDVIKESAKD